MDTEIIYSDRKTVAIEVHAGGRVIVRAPFGTSMKVISGIIDSRREWIAKTRERLKEKDETHPQKSEAEIQELIRKAKTELPPIIAKYSAVMNVTPTHFSVTRAKTRFGSCSGKNAVNFSCFLMDYPYEAIEYVVVHELAHIKQHNHSKLFWAEVEKILPDYKARQELLKK